MVFSCDLPGHKRQRLRSKLNHADSLTIICNHTPASGAHGACCGSMMLLRFALPPATLNSKRLARQMLT
jgi:hypothetical protein